jgi:FMN-dependent NADH-azoreductase
VRLLHIDASPRGDRSHTRRLTRELIDAWLRERPGDDVRQLDVGHRPPPHVDEPWIAAAFTAPDERTPAMREALRVSDELIAQLLDAEVIVAGVPMYNFSVPSGFKAYIDQIARVGVTFAFEPDDEDAPYKPLVHAKRMIVVIATGDAGYEAGGRYEHWNHIDPYLRTVFGFIGITDITFVHVGNGELGGERLADSLRRARAAIDGIVATIEQPTYDQLVVPDTLMTSHDRSD